MKQIVITAGHSNADPGAVYGGFTEAEIVTEFRNLVAFYLKQADLPFVTDGEGSTNLPLNQAIKLITPNSIAVEFHCNAFSNPTATGVETLSQSKDYELGKKLCSAIEGSLKIRNRGAKAENSGQHSRLGFVRAGGIILELFFISNPNDLNSYVNRKWLAAKAVAEVLIAEAKR